MKLPAFFIAHGSPLLALEDNEYTRLWSGLVRIWGSSAVL